MRIIFLTFKILPSPSDHEYYLILTSIQEDILQFPNSFTPFEQLGHGYASWVMAP